MKPTSNALLIITEDSPESYSPAGERIRHLALACSSRFQNVSVLALGANKRGKETQRAFKSPVTLYSIGFSRAVPFPFDGFFDPVKMLMFAVHGFSICRRIKPSYILASTPPLETSASAWFLSKLLNIELIIDLRDDWESSVGTQLKRYFPSSLLRLVSRVAGKIYSSAVAILSVTQTIIETILRRGIQTQLFLIPNGADTNVFQPLPKRNQTKVRLECSLPLDKIIVVYCGSGVNPYYRLDLVFSSISLIPKNALRKLFFVFYVYNGLNSLEELKRRLKIQDNSAEVRSPLPRNQLAKVLSSCDVGLVPFDAKSYLLCARSTKMYEYLSAGLFVISSGPTGGELDSFFSENPDLGLFTLPSASNFVRILLQVAAKHENLFKDDSRELRYAFIRKNYDRQNMMKKALDTLFAITKESEKAAPPSEEKA